MPPRMTEQRRARTQLPPSTQPNRAAAWSRATRVDSQIEAGLTQPRTRVPSCHPQPLHAAAVNQRLRRQLQPPRRHALYLRSAAARIRRPAPLGPMRLEEKHPVAVDAGRALPVSAPRRRRGEEGGKGGLGRQLGLPSPALAGASQEGEGGSV